MIMVIGRLMGVMCVVAMPAIAMATGAVTTYSGLVNQLVGLMNSGVALLVTLGIAVYFYGISTNILELSNESGVDKRKAFFLWGIIILFVMVSIWGILRIMQSTLFPSGVAASQNQKLAPEQHNA